MRADFDRFLGGRPPRPWRRARCAAAAPPHGAIVAAAVGLAGSIAPHRPLFAGYLTRAIVRPIRRAALMADRLAGGDLGTRMIESGPDEVGALERSFNVMADSLEKDRDELARLAEEQAALRRVATLVARAAPADELFAAVTEEVGQLLPVDFTRMGRYESDGTVTIVAGWSRPATASPSAPRLLGGKNVSTLVAQTGRPARMDSYADSSGAIAAVTRERHPLGGRDADHRRGPPLGRHDRRLDPGAAPAPDTEARLADFTDLVATAIANAESRADLAASRARIVATADETRRRIERDLHDGAQQRLVSLALELRAAQAAMPPAARRARGRTVSRRRGAWRAFGRVAGDRARDPSGDPGRGRPRAGAEDARPPVPDPRRARPARRGAAAGAGRGGDVLRRLGERSRTRPSTRTPRSSTSTWRRTTVAFASRSGTTAPAGRIRREAPASSV